MSLVSVQALTGGVSAKLVVSLVIIVSDVLFFKFLFPVFQNCKLAD